MFSRCTRSPSSPAPAAWPRRLRQVAACVAALGLAPLSAQLVAPLPAVAPGHWTDCTALADDTGRLACFDRWAARQASATSANAGAPPAGAVAAAAGGATAEGPAPEGTRLRVGAGADAITPAVPASADAIAYGCADRRASPLSRFWELEPGSDCGTFGIRGYRPLSLSWIGSDGTNPAPSSPAPGHTATTPVRYSTSETRIQLSMRSKIARGLLTDSASALRDSLWFGYTQQSYWQLFSGGISRPFRSTDHEPELTYILPLDAPLEHGWRLRFAGLSLNHQSNGQSLPLSRSWNRIILMAGMEQGERFTLTGRLWARVPEKDADDDNPDISDLVGRAEVAAAWYVDRTNTLGLTLRHALRSSARGSVRLEWLRSIGPPRANGEASRLRWHAQLFRGYGDSLLDYNRRRTVLSLGLSLVDF